MSSSCRDCQATIVFVTLDTGRPIPVDPIPLPDRGNVAAARRGGRLVGHVISAAKPLQAQQQRYMPHHATCSTRRGPRVTPSQRPAALF